MTVDHWDGVDLGSMPELVGASQVLLRFENVTFTSRGDPASGPVSNFTVLTGDGMQWWTAVWFELPPYGNRTTIEFSLGGFGGGPRLDAIVADQVVDHFDSIEYRLDGTASAGQRLAVRWNNGPWVVGGLVGVGYCAR